MFELFKNCSLTPIDKKEVIKSLSFTELKSRMIFSYSITSRVIYVRAIELSLV